MASITSPSCFPMDTPTAGIRWRQPLPTPLWMCSNKNGRSTSCPRKSTGWAQHLARIAELPHVGDCRQRGMMAGIELVQDRTTKQPYPWQEKHGIRACQHARKLGVWLRPLLDVIVILPPLSVTLDELDRICQAAEAGIREVT